MSSNVSNFERIYRQAVCQPQNTSLIVELKNMPDSEKPLLFKNKDAAFVSNTISNLRNTVGQICGTPAINLATSNNNQLGNDLEELNTSNSFEVKLGGMTDANLGIGIIEWSLDLKNGEVRNIMNTMLARRQMFLAGSPQQAILANKTQSKIAMETLFKSILTVGAKAPDKLAHTAKAISIGITKQQDIQNSYTVSNRKKNKVHLLVLQQDGSFAISDKAFYSNEDLLVTKLGVGTQGGGAQIHLKGSISGQTIEFRQHFKNSYTDKNAGQKIPAEFWVETPCFNVWIGK